MEMHMIMSWPFHRSFFFSRNPSSKAQARPRESPLQSQITIIMRLSPEFCRTSVSNFKFELPFGSKMFERLTRQSTGIEGRAWKDSTYKQLLEFTPSIPERLWTNSFVWLFSNCVLILSFSFLSIFSFSLLPFPFALCLDTAVVSFTELSSGTISPFIIL